MLNLRSLAFSTFLGGLCFSWASEASTIEPISEKYLQNATFTMADPESFRPGNFTLKNGEYREKNAHGSFIYIERSHTLDLNNDGAKDGLIILAESPGGTPQQISIELFIATPKGPVHILSDNLGGRRVVQGVAGGQGILIVDYLDLGDDDPLCCPSKPKKRVYFIEGDKLRFPSVQLDGVSFEK